MSESFVIVEVRIKIKGLIYQFALVISSVVETSFNRILHPPGPIKIPGLTCFFVKVHRKSSVTNSPSVIWPVLRMGVCSWCAPSVIWPVLRMGTGSVESVKNTKQHPFVVLRLLFHVKRTKTGYFVLLRLNFHVKRTKEGHFVLLKHHFR